MTLPETEAARDTNCARDAERTHASRGLLLLPYHLSDSIFGGVLDVRLLDVMRSYFPHGPHQGRSPTLAGCHRRDEPQQESSALGFLSHMRDLHTIWWEVVEVAPHHGLSGPGLV